MDEAGTTGPSTHTLLYIFIYIVPLLRVSEEEEKREKILMWDNPHVSHPSNLCRCCCHRSSNNSNSSSEKRPSLDDKRRHRLSGNAVVHDCQQTSTFTWEEFSSFFFNIRKTMQRVRVISDHSSLRLENCWTLLVPEHTKTRWTMKRSDGPIPRGIYIRVIVSCLTTATLWSVCVIFRVHIGKE
jgi:hypothetical protein